MIRGLFARLTGEPMRGQALFDLAVGEARRPHWFVEGRVPDTVNGRFAVLATIVALMMVRLERGGADGERAGVALTERLVESLDTEIREMGLGEPALGKQVRRLVGAVSGRVERWRALIDSDKSWSEEIRRSLYLGDDPGEAAMSHSESELRRLWQRLADARVEHLEDGRME
ncbi:MAG TPA: ubiquinol-cytochrome C chaperone family protein [Sphingomicrobium sp.]|nr:ubiquinol-cytochrome C chaperone family protein [Sphingomicrobium sp.]